MQSNSTFATYQTGLEMIEFDITSYFDLAAASQEEMQVCEDIIMADMSEADAMAVSLQSQDSSSMDVEMKTDNLPVYGYDEFGKQYMLTPKQQYEAIAEAEFEAFLAEVDYHDKQLSTFETARAKAAKVIVKEEKRQAREAAREAQYAAREAQKANRKAQKANRGARETVRVEAVANAPESATIFTKKNVKADLIRCSFLDSMENSDSSDWFAQEYVRALRLLTVERRWMHITIPDWIREIRLLTKAVSNPKGDLKLWEPLAEWLSK